LLLALSCCGDNVFSALLSLLVVFIFLSSLFLSYIDLLLTLDEQLAL